MDALVKQCEAAGEAVKQAKAAGDAADIKAKVAALVKIGAKIILSQRVDASTTPHRSIQPARQRSRLTG